MLVGSNPTEGGGFFQRKEPPPGHGCVVYVSSGLTVGWWKEESTLFRPPPRGQHGFESRREKAPMGVRWNGRGWPGKVPRSPVASPEKAKEQGNWNGKQRPTERYRKKSYGKKREWQFKKKKKISILSDSTEI
jgi:hypothetical protein